MAEKSTGATISREFLAERDLRIFKMRQGGVAISEIGRRFGITASVVTRAIARQLERLNREALMAYPEVLRMELERLDSLQAAIWPLTQHRRVSLDDGTEIQVEPDMKAIQQVLSIMDRRSKLLGIEHSTVAIKMDLSTNLAEPIRVSMSGENRADAIGTHSPEAEARQLLEIMATSGVLPKEDVDRMLGNDDDDIVDAEIVEVPRTEDRE